MIVRKIIRSNIDVPDEVVSFFESHGISIDVVSLDDGERTIFNSSGSRMCDDLFDYCITNSRTKDVYLLSQPSKDRYESILPDGLSGAFDGFSYYNLAIVHSVYVENILHELLHAAVDADDCYLRNKTNHHECDEEKCVMRYGNRRGLSVCGRVKSKL